MAAGMRLSGPLKSLVRKVRWQKRRPQTDPNDFVPFQIDDIALEDLMVPWNLATSSTTTRGRLLPSPGAPPAYRGTYIPPNTSKQPRTLATPAMPSGVHRKGRLPAITCEREDDGNARRQKENLYDTRDLQARSDYVVYHKASP
ncbi:hypothetical protein FRC19_005463 [Serendipita sp. 401]|nr:hypothetical protein FRC19_005463 [Serendipita sp. 401]KAG9053552.1 hypothetical protein FS842_007869 [Serendipita sp. 407]